VHTTLRCCPGITVSFIAYISFKFIKDIVDADAVMLLRILYPFFFHFFLLLFHFLTEIGSRFSSVETSVNDVKLLHNVQNGLSSRSSVFQEI